MKSEGKRKDGEFDLSLRSLFLVVAAVSAALLCAILLTYFFTKNSFEPRSLRVKRDNGATNRLDDEAGEIEEPPPPAEKLRLPQDLRPQSYDLNMKVHLPGYGAEIEGPKNLTFDATLVTRISVFSTTNKIVLNLKKLNISDVYVTMNDQPVTVLSKTVEEKLELVTIQLAKNLEIGSRVVLTLVYVGPIDNSLGGLYQSKYKHTDGTERIIATSQMEPTDARRMVPCFDEPSFKANWTVTVTHPKGTSALSNSIEDSVTPIDAEWLESKFKATPKMSSYLLAVLVSEFEYNEGQTKSGIRFRVWGRPEAKDQTKYALEAGIKCIEHYEQFYGIPFPLEKQDMVALPDFAAGAMENWGLITYRENSLLYDATLYKPEQKQRVAVVVAHELAHQWFGNLVTMKWWSELWLNEGFAAFVEYLGTDFISDRKFRMDETFVIDAQETGFKEDAIPTSHPLSFKIDRASEVEEAFDGITYDKGSAVIRMIRYTMGEEIFDKAINLYLKRFSYNNADATDLMTALGEFVPGSVLGADGKKLDVLEYAQQWTQQMGYPVLTVSRMNDHMVRVVQNRFKLANDTPDQEKYSKPDYGFKWDVPVWYSKGGDDTTHFAWLPRDADLIVGARGDAVPIFNYDSRGFYRVNYDAELWMLIAKKLQEDHTVFSTKTRTRLLSDAFAMAEAGILEYKIPFTLMGYLAKETEYLPWQSAIDSIRKIGNYFGSEPEIRHLRAYIKKIGLPLYRNASVDHVTDTYLNDDTYFENLLESRSIAFMCSARDASCLSTYVDHFKTQFLDNCDGTQMSSKCSKASVPLRAGIYCEGVAAGDRGVWARVFEAYQMESNQVEKSSLLYALSCSREVDVLKELLAHALNWPAGVVRLQDVDSVFSFVSVNPTGRAFLFGYLLDKWSTIYASLKSDQGSLRHTVKYCTNPIRTKWEVDELENFQKTQPTELAKHAFEEAIALGRQRVAWISKNYDSLTNFFKIQTL